MYVGEHIQVSGYS